MRKQLKEDISSDDFEIGLVDVVRIRSGGDFAEFGLDINKPESKLSLWCDVGPVVSEDAVRVTLQLKANGN